MSDRPFVTIECVQGRHGDCWDFSGLLCECPTCYADRLEMFARWEEAAQARRERP